MKLSSLAWLPLLALLASTHPLSAAAMDQNPALQYYRAFILAPDLAPGERDYLLTNDWRGQPLPEKVTALLGQYDNQFSMLRLAAASTAPCDWGIDLSPGPATLLPHLGRCKAIAQLSRLRVLMALQNGRQDDARDDLLAALALGRNCATDGTLISVLVQIAIENIVCTTIAENFYLFTPETLKEIAAGMARGPARRTCADSIPAEKFFRPLVCRQNPRPSRNKCGERGQSHGGHKRNGQYF